MLVPKIIYTWGFSKVVPCHSLPAGAKELVNLVCLGQQVSTTFLKGDVQVRLGNVVVSMNPPLLLNPGRAQWVSRYSPVVAQADFVGVCVLALSHHRHSVVLSESPKLDGRWSSLQYLLWMQECKYNLSTHIQRHLHTQDTFKTLSGHFQDTFKTLSRIYMYTYIYIHVYIYIHIYISYFAMIVCTLFDGHFSTACISL